MISQENMIKPANLTQQRGYIALVALLIVVAAGLTIGLAVSLGGLDQIQMSFANSEAVKAKALANACVEEGLERLRNGLSYSGSLSVNGNSCIITTVSNGSNYDLSAQASVNNYTQKIKVTVSSDLNNITRQEE
jgi:hypothetical protein